MQTPHAWRGIRQRPHHLALRFAAAGHLVRWVEPRYLRWLVQGKADDFLRAHAEQPAGGFEVRPVILVNGEALPPVRAHNKFWLARALERGLNGAAGPRILWLYNPHEVHLADSVGHDLLVYDIMDEYQGFPWSPPHVGEEESALLGRADWAFAGTHALAEAKAARAGERIECILSGVETAVFSAPGEPDRQMAELRRRHGRLAGYAGMLDLRIDIELLRRAAAELPGWGFVLVGPVAREVREGLRDLPNVHLPGPRPYAELAACYRAWNAALLPFVENDLTRHINPTKMLEYGAASLPIVARDLPDVRRCYADGAWIYGDADGFIAALRAIETGDGVEAKTSAARAWARERDWDRIAANMLERVEGLLAQKQSGGPA